MAETAAYDPMDAATEHPAEDSQSGQAAIPEMGAGLFEANTPGQDSEAVTGHTGEADAGQGDARPGQDERTAAEPADEHERERGYLRQDDYTRKTTELANRERDLEQRYQQRLDEIERRHQTWLQEQTQSTQQQREQQQQTTSLGQQMLQYSQELATNPDVSPVDRQGVAFMAQAVSQMEAQARTIAELQERLEQYGPRIDQTHEVVTQMTQERHNALLSRLSAEAQEAKEAFGEETYQWASQALAPILRGVLEGQPMPKDESGKTLTIPDLVARLSGRSLEHVQAAREGNAAGRRQARSGASTPSASPSVSTPTAGPISREQALAEIAQVGVRG